MQLANATAINVTRVENIQMKRMKHVFRVFHDDGSTPELSREYKPGEW